MLLQKNLVTHSDASPAVPFRPTRSRRFRAVQPGAWHFALVYAAGVSIWIITDLFLFPPPGTDGANQGALPVELLKDLGFVVFTTLLVYGVVARMISSNDRSERRLRLLAEHVPDLIFRLRVYPDVVFEYVSPAAVGLAGYTPDEFYANPELAYRLVHPDDHHRLVAVGKGLMLVGASPVEVRWVRKCGAVIWTEQRNVPVYDRRGRLVAIEGVARDITERKAAEEQIARQRRALERVHAALVASYDVTLSGWTHALDLRDHETEGHSSRVATLSVRLAQLMGFRGDELECFRRGALLHDIGKIGIPDAILHKPGPLSEAEWCVMRRHPEYARDLLEPIEFLRPALDIPFCHHERWDGSGYPRGLQGEAIPLAARIFAVVDVWDALSSNRPYRTAWSPDQVRAYLTEQAGQLFDPAVVRMFLTMIEADYRPLQSIPVKRRVA